MWCMLTLIAVCFIFFFIKICTKLSSCHKNESIYRKTATLWHLNLIHTHSTQIFIFIRENIIKKNYIFWKWTSRRNSPEKEKGFCLQTVRGEIKLSRNVDSYALFRLLSNIGTISKIPESQFCTKITYFQGRKSRV